MQIHRHCLLFPDFAPLFWAVWDRSFGQILRHGLEADLFEFDHGVGFEEIFQMIFIAFGEEGHTEMGSIDSEAAIDGAFALFMEFTPVFLVEFQGVGLVDGCGGVAGLLVGAGLAIPDDDAKFFELGGIEFLREVAEHGGDGIDIEGHDFFGDEGIRFEEGFDGGGLGHIEEGDTAQGS